MISESRHYNDNEFPFSDHEMKAVYKAIFSRRDVRSHFMSDKAIPDEVLLRILNAHIMHHQ